MNSRRHGLISICLLLIGSAPPAGAKAPATPPAEKVAVTDGHTVHDVGQLLHHTTNWGLIGSTPGMGAPWADAPSAEWPAHSGIEHLWAAGLWVGGVVGGEVGGEIRVTTGGFQSEFLPTAAALDTIYTTAHGMPGGNRFPWPDADDDADGQEDEELLNGLDDDGDGRIDEDHAAIADQHFVCRYNDSEAALAQTRPDHTPLGIEVVQQSIQWDNEIADDFVGYDFTITNIGADLIEQVYLGIFSDFDIGPRSLPNADDDSAGFLSASIEIADGVWIPIQVAYMYDQAAINPQDSYIGWVLCGHTLDPAGLTAPAEAQVRSFQRFAGQLPFSSGGDPTNDAERYDLLSRQEWDTDVLAGRESDYRVMIGSGPFASLAPGESISYQAALVAGTGLGGMLINAAVAVAAYRGLSYDRDGDAGNGAEYTVHWLLDEDAPVASWTGYLMAARAADGVELTIETNLESARGLSVRRGAAPGVTGRTWSGADLTSVGSGIFRLLDSDRTGWPRSYELAFEDEGRILPLDRKQVDAPGPMDVELVAGPNPFNPQLNIRFAQPQPGRMLLQAFDVRGRCVRTLIDETRPEGPGTIVWRGDDDAGRSLASGVYQLRLATEGELVETRVTLVR